MMNSMTKYSAKTVDSYSYKITQITHKNLLKKRKRKPSHHTKNKGYPKKIHIKKINSLRRKKNSILNNEGCT